MPKSGHLLTFRLVKSLLFLLKTHVLLLREPRQKPVLRLLKVFFRFFILVNLLVEIEKRLLGTLRIYVLVRGYEVRFVREEVHLPLPLVGGPEEGVHSLLVLLGESFGLDLRLEILLQLTLRSYPFLEFEPHFLLFLF